MKLGSKILIIVALIVLVGVFVLFTGSETDVAVDSEDSDSVSAGQVAIGSEDVEETFVVEEENSAVDRPAWLDFELEDVSTGENFKISDFSGKPILLESFAVWCPKCTSQQKQIRELHLDVGESVVSISIDTDASEDADFIREHIARHGFDWRYAISPSEMTMLLIDEFGNSIISAPSVPKILICNDLSFRKLPSGNLDSSELKDEIALGC